MNSITRDFVSQEPRKFTLKIGRYLASSLTGFVAGIIAASIIWLIGIWYFNQAQTIAKYISASDRNSTAQTASPIQSVTQKAPVAPTDSL